MTTPRRSNLSRHRRGRVRSQGSPRPLACALLAALAALAMAGCEQRAEYDRWPMAVTTHQGAQVVAHAPGPVTLVVEPATVMQVGDHVRCMVAAPDEGFLVFCGRTLVHLRYRDSTWSCADFRPIDRQVRAAALSRPLVATITGGRPQAPGQPARGAGEPPPWLLGGEVRLAWFEGSDFVVGKSELPADVNPWRIRAGRFAGEQNLLVFVYNQAPFDDVMRRRPWIYRVVEGEDGLPHLDPRWRGTSFAHPFRDATFCDLSGAGEGEIAALEVAEDGGRMLTAYHFEGFGLEGMAPSLELPEVEDRIEAVHLDRNATDELLVHASEPPRFICYGLRGPEPLLLEVARAPAPTDVLGWVPLREEAGRFEIFCVLGDGSTQVVEVPTADRPVAP